MNTKIEIKQGNIETLMDPEQMVICKHCGKSIDHTMLIGLSLICPQCGKPQNGHPQKPKIDQSQEISVICKHCGNTIDQSKLLGISLICPLCGKPQNGGSLHASDQTT